MHRDRALVTEVEQRLELRRVLGVLHHREVVGQKHGVKIETLEAAQMHARHAGAVAGHADKPDEPLLSRFDRGAQRALRAHRELPLLLLHEIVQLKQIQLVDPQAFERAANLPTCGFVGPLSGLGGEKETMAVLAHPRPDPQLRIAVRRCRVDMVHARFQQEAEPAIGFLLGDGRQRGSPKEKACALMARSSEGQGGEHGITFPAWGTVCGE